MYLFRLAMASLANRRFTAILTAFAIALSVCLLLAVERVRVEARNSFASTISGTDLIVGARSVRSTCCCIRYFASATPPTTSAGTATSTSPPAPR